MLLIVAILGSIATVMLESVQSWQANHAGTVGYCDIAPVTPFGQAVASLVMILEYGVIAVPTGIVTAELTEARTNRGNPARMCEECGQVSNDSAAAFCSRCSASLS